MTSPHPATANQSLFLKEIKPAHSLGALLGVGWLVGLADAMRPAAASGDIDDTLRALQIKDLLADGQWFDRHLPQIALPEAYASPWSRLVDLPYVALTKLFDIALPAETAFRIATLVWPAMLLLAFSLLVHTAQQRLLSRNLRLIELIGFIVLFAQAALEFAPGRIDHHNVQFVFMAGIACALTYSPGWKPGAVLGLLTAASIVVGLEIAPLLAVLTLGLGLAACFDNTQNRLRLIGFGTGLAVSTLVLSLVFIGPSAMMTIQYDALSAPYIAALIGTGLICSAAPLIWPRLPKSSLLRFTSLAVPALALISGLIVAFPDSLNGPYQMIDPLSQSFWLANVPMEQTAFTLVPQVSKLTLTALLCLSILSVALSAPILLSKDKSNRILWALAACAVLLAISQVRHMRLALLMAFIVSPVAISFVMAQTRVRIKGLAGAGASIALFLAIGFSPIGQLNEANTIAYTLMAGETCAENDLSALSDLTPGRILAPFGIGARILEENTPHTLSTIPFHRAAPGIHEMATAYAVEAAQPIQPALNQIDYVIVCARDWDMPLDAMPLYRDLIEQTPRAGLTLTSPAAHGEFAIYRVD